MHENKILYETHLYYIYKHVHNSQQHVGIFNIVIGNKKVNPCDFILWVKCGKGDST